MATAGVPRRFCRCACFCSENLYVARYGIHVRFRGEQQLRRDYGQVLRSRGCVSPKDFQELLGELEQEVERRQRLGQESAARKALISSSYHPARPDIYNMLQDEALAPEFLAAAEYSTSPGADLEGLLQRLETVSAEKRIYRLPVFTAPFCQALLEELEHFEHSDMPKGRPNTMNNYGAPSALARPLEVEHVVGQGILHRGGQLHGARPLGTGERWNLVVWLRASAVRNRLCPMCCRKPELVDDEGFGDGFTREEPVTVDVCALT